MGGSTTKRKGVVVLYSFISCRPGSVSAPLRCHVSLVKLDHLRRRAARETYPFSHASRAAKACSNTGGSLRQLRADGGHEHLGVVEVSCEVLHDVFLPVYQHGAFTTFDVSIPA